MVLLDLIEVLELKISLETRNLHAARIPSHSDVEPGLAASISAAHKLASASKDLRSALSAYAHRIHVPRPKAAVIAGAQDTNAQGLARRYNERTQQAIEALIAGSADAETLRSAFPSLTQPRPSEWQAVSAAMYLPLHHRCPRQHE